MNEVPPGQDEPDDADDLYRRASALDESRPSELVRRRVLNHAAQRAAERAAPKPGMGSAPAANRTWWHRRPAIFGTLAAAALAGLVVLPRFLTPSVPPTAPSANRLPEPAADVSATDSLSKMQSMTAARSRVAATNASQAGAPPRPMAPFAAAQSSVDPSAELRRAAEFGVIPELQILLDKQPLIEARDENGRTALMLAALHGQSKAVAVLLAHGADPNAADVHGTTPLQAAVAGNHQAIAAALRRAGAR